MVKPNKLLVNVAILVVFVSGMSICFGEKTHEISMKSFAGGFMLYIFFKEIEGIHDLLKKKQDGNNTTTD